MPRESADRVRETSFRYCNHINKQHSTQHVIVETHHTDRKILSWQYPEEIISETDSTRIRMRFFFIFLILIEAHMRNLLFERYLKRIYPIIEIPFAISKILYFYLLFLRGTYSYSI